MIAQEVCHDLEDAGATLIGRCRVERALRLLESELALHTGMLDVNPATREAFYDEDVPCRIHHGPFPIIATPNGRCQIACLEVETARHSDDADVLIRHEDRIRE